jgi:hypothetical protein
VIGAEGAATAIAMELAATGAQQFAAGRVSTVADFQDGVSKVAIVLEGKALEKRAAGLAASGRELLFHEIIICRTPFSMQALFCIFC